MKILILLAIVTLTTGLSAHDLTVVREFADGTRTTERVTLARQGDVAEYRIARGDVQPDAKKLGLVLAEFGGRPTFYVYARFKDGGKTGSMGDVDLTCATDEELARTVAAIREGSEEYARRSDLQYCFMEKHERLAEGVARITYSNGAVMTVNCNDRPYGDVPALDYRIVRPN